jgi:transcription elongation factor GreA-like protein
MTELRKLPIEIEDFEEMHLTEIWKKNVKMHFSRSQMSGIQNLWNRKAFTRL